MAASKHSAVSATCLASFVILVVLMCLFVVGFSLPDWVHLDDGTRIGLWQICNTIDGERTCTSFERGERDGD